MISHSGELIPLVGKVARDATPLSVAAVAITLAVCVTVLAILHLVDGQAAIGFFGLIAGLGGGVGAHASGGQAGQRE